MLGESSWQVLVDFCVYDRNHLRSKTLLLDLDNCEMDCWLFLLNLFFVFDEPAVAAILYLLYAALAPQPIVY
jgi:hypothetical protein